MTGFSKRHDYELSCLDESVETVFLSSEKPERRFAIESTDGLLIYVHSPREVDGERLTVVVDELLGSTDRELSRLKGSTLSFVRGATFAPELPVSCRAVFSDGRSALLRFPGVRYAGGS